MPPPTAAETAAQRQGAIGQAVGQVILSGTNTALSLVSSATAADIARRRDEATAAGARIAREASRVDALIAAQVEAEGAATDGAAAGVQARAGDVTGANATLASAQGRLAAAIGAASIFPRSQALEAAIQHANAVLTSVIATISAATPAGIVPPAGGAPLPPTVPPTPAPTVSTTPWLLVGLSVLALAFVAARRSS